MLGGMSLTFRDASARVDAFISQFEEGYFPPLLMLARLTEETGEIARQSTGAVVVEPVPVWAGSVGELPAAGGSATRSSTMWTEASVSPASERVSGRDLRFRDCALLSPTT